MPAILHDKFYTPAPTARKCVGALWRVLGMQPNDFFVEPSAGAGAFCRHLPQGRLLALDIVPEAEGIITGDFLTFEAPAHEGRVIVIGNPPFGRNGALARAFLHHAMEFADIVAFILPASFAKPSMQRGINPHFHLVHSASLDDQHFETAEGDRLVNTVFQIWQKRDGLRRTEIEPVAKVDFEFVTDIRVADLVIRRVGTRAGAVMARPALTDDGPVPSGYSPSSNYYIKAVGCDPVRLEERLRALDLSRPAGIAVYPSLSKQELVGTYAEASKREMVLDVPAGLAWKGPMIAAAGGSVVGRGRGDLIWAGGRTAMTAQASIFRPCGHSAEVSGQSRDRVPWTDARLDPAEMCQKDATALRAVERSPAAPSTTDSAAMDREPPHYWLRRHSCEGIVGQSNSCPAGLAQRVRESLGLEADGVMRSLRESQAKDRRRLWLGHARTHGRQTAGGSRPSPHPHCAPDTPRPRRWPKKHSEKICSGEGPPARGSARHAIGGVVSGCGRRGPARDAHLGRSMRSMCSYSINASLWASCR